MKFLKNLSLVFCILIAITACVSVAVFAYDAVVPSNQNAQSGDQPCIPNWTESNCP